MQGASFEGYVIENIPGCVPDGVQGHFYRSAAGAEIDLLLVWPNGRSWAIEIKRSLTPKLEHGFHAACADLEPERRVVVYPGTGRCPVAPGVDALPLRDFVSEFSATRAASGRKKRKR